MGNDFIKKYLSIFNFLTLSEKRSAVIIFINGFINLIFDLLSIGLIIPIIYSIINSEEFNIPFIENFELNLYTSLSIFFLVIIIKNVYYYYNSKLLLKFCKNLYERISIGLLKSQLNTSYLEYLKLGYSDFSRYILIEVNYLVAFYRGIITFVIHTFILVGIIIFLFYYNFTASLSLIVFYLIFLFLPSIFIYKKIDRLAKERKFLDGNKIYISNHIFQNLSIIKLYNKELYFVDFFKKANHGQQENIFEISKIQLLPKIFVELTTLLFLTLMISSNIYFEITLEKMILSISVYLFAAVRLMPSIHEIMSSLQNVRYFYNSFVSIDHKINKRKIIHQKLDTKVLNINFKNNIIIQDLSFKYPGEEKKIITNLNFEIKKNTLFGIHGESGSGKSTLINLILGLLNPESGQIKCDDVDVSRNINGWQDLISYVPSRYLLLNSELKKNVAYGEKNFEINENHVTEALKNAQLYMSQNKLDSNFFVEEDGKNLSAGQIQRICISRAFYRNTPILILDEPTSNLDKENSYKIISLIKNIKNLTTIIVSHDHNIINMCDDNIKLD